MYGLLRKSSFMREKELSRVPESLMLLAHEVRWHIVEKLQQTDQRVQELVEALSQPMNLVSYHLKLLREGGLVYSHRSEADGRDIYYALNWVELTTFYEKMGKSLAILPPQETSQIVKPVRLLFLCTGNSARSQMAEALMRNMHIDGLVCMSAGNNPQGIHPYTLQILEQYSIETAPLASTHIDSLIDQPFDFVITLCDRMREECPTILGASRLIHWSIPDPAQTPEENWPQAFEETFKSIQIRLDHFLTQLYQP